MTTIPAPFVTAVRHLLAAGWKRSMHNLAGSHMIAPGYSGSIGWRLFGDLTDSVEVDIRTAHGHTIAIEPCSLTEAIDLLVAVGILPPSMSSAYAAGWAARDMRTLMHAAMQRRVAEALVMS